LARRVALGVAIGLGVLLLLDAIARRAGLVPGALPTLPGATAWITSRAAGITAFAALALDVLFGLFVSTGAADKLLKRAHTAEIHRWLSTVALGMIALHALALLGDRFVRFDALDLLVPFLSPYRAFAVGLGVVAAWIALVVHLSFGWRRRIGAKGWRRLHKLSYVALAAAIAHGLFA
jgi:methionine sulfoxide reductase heme-binding subunit